MRRLVRPILASCAMVLLGFSLARGEITATKTDQGVSIKIDGQPFAEYISDSGGKPILWPIIGPTGKPMTRPFPMAEPTPGGTKDHRWHRSFYFGHGWVNGVDFWTDGKNKRGEERGKTVQKEIVKMEGGKTATIVTRDDWMSGDGKTKIAEDERTWRFSTDGDTRIIDFDVAVTASNGPLTFGDTKEGTFALRVADSMRVAANQGGKIINSEGLTNKDMWGKQASWVDYNGPIDGETVGIAVLNHPSSFKYPTYWQVRPYGLFAVNPFGLTDYEMEINTGKGPPGEDAQFTTLEEAKARKGTVTIPAGETVTFRYRILFHKGDEKQGKVAEAFEAYSKQP